MKHNQFRSRGFRWGALLSALLMLGLCLAPLAAMAKNSNPNNPPNNPNLPPGRPFQILQGEIDALQTQINQINATLSKFAGFEYELLTLTNSGHGNDVIPINPDPQRFTITPGGKQVRFEISFVPTAAATPVDTFIMAAIASPATGPLNSLGTNSNGAPVIVNNLIPLPATLATITGVANLLSTTGSAFEIQEIAAPKGTYFVKIYY